MKCALSSKCAKHSTQKLHQIFQESPARGNGKQFSTSVVVNHKFSGLFCIFVLCTRVTSAFDSTKRRQTSRLPCSAEQSSGVRCLKKSNGINLRKQSFASQNKKSKKSGVCGNYTLSFASTSALHCSKRRQTSRWSWTAEKCSGVH
jgi:hypothetical protein